MRQPTVPFNSPSSSLSIDLRDVRFSFLRDAVHAIAIAVTLHYDNFCKSPA